MLKKIETGHISEAGSAIDIRHDWDTAEIEEILTGPLLDLIYHAQSIHRTFHAENNVQLASLLNIKTGGCPEDCKYCSQSAHYGKTTGLKKEPLMAVEDVLEKARQAKEAGASRFCMGAAWREVHEGEEFESVIGMVRGVRALGMEACVTLGMLNKDQAKRLADAGLTAYNHNLDTSEEFYGDIISTRTYQDRLDTIENVREAGIDVCTGGIIGLGETIRDRASMLKTLACLDPHPESVPINALVPVSGTPLADQKSVDATDMIRMVATARIVMPKSRVRLSAGRRDMNREAQLLCFLAGANSIFYGDKLLTTANNDTLDDLDLLKEAGISISAGEKDCGCSKSET